MITQLLGIKKDQKQSFDSNGKRIPVTLIKAGPCYVVQIKTKDKDGYQAIQCGLESKKRVNKPQEGHIKKTKIKIPFRFLHEMKFKGEIDKKPGDVINITDVLKEGDLVNVIGISKGKGFAGVVKRHHFRGGPKTHGQSDRLRAPGSIGSTTTPGRVFKGKKMAGRLGGSQVTIRNLKVFKIDSENNLVMIKGLVPGGKNNLLVISKIS